MTKEELIQKTNDAIAELVYDKDDLMKAYNYYNGKRDEELFRYLEENFGIGNPTSVKFTPLIKKHVDALVGEYLGNPILPKVSCKDVDTINKINREKQLHISREVYLLLLKSLKNKILDFILTLDESKLKDPYILKSLDNLVEDLDTNFISLYEIAAQDVVEYIMLSKATDLDNKLKLLLLDLLITGYTFYKVKPSPERTNVQIEVLNPLNVFLDKNPNSPYVKDSYRAVVRKWLTRTLIINIYGRDLNKDDLLALKEAYKTDLDYKSKYVRVMDTGHETMGIVADKEAYVVPGQPSTRRFLLDVLPVYEVEWLEVDKNFKMWRYETVRIGDEIYILKGKVEDAIRTKDNPSHCTLSLNGVYFDNRSEEPFSLVLACASLLDEYDLLRFFLDNLIANSGTVGDWIDVSLLPAYLGTRPEERLKKFIAYKKLGLGVIDSALEGRMATGQAPLNTIFNGFDDTVKAPSILGIQMAIDQIELTMSSITGVFRERLNGIEAKDAVTNVKIGQTNSFTISKLWYQHMDTVTEEILLDALNVGKVVYKKGLTGTILLGEKKQRIFTALPEYFTLTDYDIRILASAEITRDIEAIKALIPEFIRAGTLDPQMIFEAMTSKSLTDLKAKVNKALKKQKQENNALAQAQLLLQEALQLIQQLQKDLQKAQTKIESLNEAKLQIEQLKVQSDSLINWFKAKTEREYKQSEAANDTKRTQIEYMQLHDGNPYNDEVRNI